MEGPRYCSWAPERLLLDPIARRMKAEALGGYISLLLEMWVDPQFSLPDDPETLALLSRLGKSWPKHSKIILSCLELREGRYYSLIIDEAVERIMEKSALGKLAVQARIDKYRKVQSITPSDDDRAIIGRSSKEKENEKAKENPPTSPPGGGGVGLEFLDFWKMYSRLGGVIPVNKAGAEREWDRLIKSGVNPCDIIHGLKTYDGYLTARIKGGKKDARSYVTSPEKWLRQNRFRDEYPTAAQVIKDAPVCGVDFYWREEDGRMGRYWIIAGDRTEILFSSEEWAESKK